jgi:hypothetical protein
VNDSHDWAPRQGIMVNKFEGELERRRSVTFRVTMHLNNIPLKLWSGETSTKIMEDFGEPASIDNAIPQSVRIDVQFTQWSTVMMDR